MSIFKNAIDKLLGRKKLQEELKEKKEYANNLEKTIIKLTNPTPCVNKLIYNVNQKTLQVISCSGDTYSGFNIQPEQLESFRNADNETIIKLLTPKQEVTVKEINHNAIEKELVTSFLDIFESIEDFEVVGNSVFFRGVKSVEIPSLIVAAFIEILNRFEQPQTDEEYNSTEQEYQSLKAFTLKLLTSPRQESIDQVLSFCRHNDLRISKRGNIIAYRRVKEFTDVTMPDNSELAVFVQESANKIKKWKKSAKNYEVFDDNGYVFIHTDKLNKYNKHVGNLYELYNNQSALKPETTKLYTSSHNYGKYTFAIGDIYKAEDGDIDIDAGNCASGGLHFAACDYNYSGFGDTPIVVLINPAKTITIPIDEMQKGRTTEMKIACINPNEHGIHIDESLIEQADIEFDEYTLEELQQVISQKTLKPLSVEEEVTNLSIPEVVNIKDLLSKRVVNI